MRHCRGWPTEQLPCFQPERGCQALDIVERDVSYLPFHMGYEGAVQASFKRQRFLAPTALTT